MLLMNNLSSSFFIHFNNLFTALIASCLVTKGSNIKYNSNPLVSCEQKKVEDISYHFDFNILLIILHLPNQEQPLFSIAGITISKASWKS